MTGLLRRALVAGAGVILTLSAVPPAAGAATARVQPRACPVRADWPQDGLTASHQSDNVRESTLTARNLGLLRPTWTATAASYLLGGPSVAGGRVFFGAADGALHAVSASTGTPLWTTPFHLYVVGPPAVADGIVYVGDHSSAAVGAFDAATGTNLWVTSTLGFVDTSPTVTARTVYVGTGNGGHGHDLGYFYALDRLTGAVRWTFELSYYVAAPPAVGDGMVYVGGADGFLYALDEETGAQRWRVDLGSPFGMGWPMYADGLVYVDGFAADGTATLFAFDVTKGALRWSHTSSGISGPRPAYAHGVVFQPLPDGLHAFAAATGAPVWVAAGASGQPVVANGVVYMATSGGLRAVTAATGASVRTGAAADVTDSVVVVNGTVYGTASGGSEVKAYSLGGVFARTGPRPDVGGCCTAPTGWCRPGSQSR